MFRLQKASSETVVCFFIICNPRQGPLQGTIRRAGWTKVLTKLFLLPLHLAATCDIGPRLGNGTAYSSVNNLHTFIHICSNPKNLSSGRIVDNDDDITWSGFKVSCVMRRCQFPKEPRVNIVTRRGDRDAIISHADFLWVLST